MDSKMKTIEYGNRDADIVLIQPVDDHDLDVIESEIRLIGELSGKGPDGFRLIAVKIDDWNRDLSPWEAPPVFGKEPFGAGAEDTLKSILDLCATVSEESDKEKKYYIGGYSLAGLFALWAAYKTDMFSGVAAASPSAWYPGFLEYMRSGCLLSPAVYLSLGDKEEKTRNPVMATVGSCIRQMEEIVRARGARCTLEWNQGNHFKDPDLRTAKAFAWVIGQ